MQRQTLTRMILNDDQNPESSFVKELIRDEVHAPAFVPGLRCRPDLPLNAGNTASGDFLTHSEAFLAVEPVDPFALDLPPFAPEKDVEPAIAVGNSDARQLLQT